MTKCNLLNCKICPFVTESKIVFSSSNAYSVTLKHDVTCESMNVVYVITCNKKECKYVQYIGETERKLKDRILEHLYYVRSGNSSTTVGEHFNLPGHSIANMKTCIIEKCLQNSRMYRSIRESFFINKFQTKYKGLNRKK